MEYKDVLWSTARLLLSGFVAASVACTQVTVRTAPRFSAIVTIDADSVELRRISKPGGIAFTVDATITNTGTEPLYASTCGNVAEREIDGVWVPVFDREACANWPWLRAIEPGQAMHRQVWINEFSEAQAAHSIVDPRLAPGKYRLRLRLGTRASIQATTPMSITPLPSDFAVSPPFDVVGGP
jgi:hypothetical protein